jgi:hypothetical protein
MPTDSCNVLKKLRVWQVLTERSKLTKPPANGLTRPNVAKCESHLREFNFTKVQSADFRRWSSLA